MVIRGLVRHCCFSTFHSSAFWKRCATCRHDSQLRRCSNGYSLMGCLHIGTKETEQAIYLRLWKGRRFGGRCNRHHYFIERHHSWLPIYQLSFSSAEGRASLGSHCCLYHWLCR